MNSFYLQAKFSWYILNISKSGIFLSVAVKLNVKSCFTKKIPGNFGFGFKIIGVPFSKYTDFKPLVDVKQFGF